MRDIATDSIAQSLRNKSQDQKPLFSEECGPIKCFLWPLNLLSREGIFFIEKK